MQHVAGTGLPQRAGDGHPVVLRRVLRRGFEHHSETSWARLVAGLDAGDSADQQIGKTWIAAQDLRRLFRCRSRAEAERALERWFWHCADALLEAMRPSWRNEKHAAQWTMTLKVYASPLHNLPIDQIETTDVLQVLQPIWSTKPETASRVRGRIERVLD